MKAGLFCTLEGSLPRCGQRIKLAYKCHKDQIGLLVQDLLSPKVGKICGEALSASTLSMRSLPNDRYRSRDGGGGGMEETKDDVCST